MIGDGTRLTEALKLKDRAQITLQKCNNLYAKRVKDVAETAQDLLICIESIAEIDQLIKEIKEDAVGI